MQQHDGSIWQNFKSLNPLIANLLDNLEKLLQRTGNTQGGSLQHYV